MRRILMGLVRMYQVALSPYVGGHCRYAPTCSQYMLDALQAHGAWRGLCLGVGRLLRCHPFHPGGLDPVPGSRK